MTEKLNYELLTEYGERLDKSRPLAEYPRPQLVRKSYMNLNGEWSFSIFDGRKEGNCAVESGKITVPFPLGCCLSGVKNADGTPRSLKKSETVSYCKEFFIDGGFLSDITLLHIGAADQICEVFVNGKLIGKQQGSYLPFDLDISSAIHKGSNTLTVNVSDSTSFLYPTGKQREKRGGIWYTPISGIWQTVWLESVSSDYIKKIDITPEFDLSSVRFDIESAAKAFDISISFDEKVIKKLTSHQGSVTVEFDSHDLHPWSPEEPSLYRLTVKTEGDEVGSYFAMRKFTAEDGCFMLNNKPYFINGLLDQGYFSDGIYTPAGYDAYRDDILKMKKLGFNALRKHIKIEPMMFYHYCDTLGMLVLQDMVNVGRYSFFKDTVLPFAFNMRSLPYINVNKAQRQNFASHAEKTVRYLYSCPSVVYYTVFNEGWGQFDGDRMYRLLHGIDGTRVYDSTSGWFYEKLSDVFSEHIYFKPIKPKKPKDGSERPWIVSEFGGYSLPCRGHLFNGKKEFGYKKFGGTDELNTAFIALYETEIIKNIKNGLAGAVYTQLSDVEDEVNGILTYDRKKCKLNEGKIKALNERLYLEFADSRKSKKGD